MLLVSRKAVKFESKGELEESEDGKEASFGSKIWILSLGLPMTSRRSPPLLAANSGAPAEDLVPGGANVAGESCFS